MSDVCWERDKKCCAFSSTFAFNPYFAAVQFYDFFNELNPNPVELSPAVGRAESF